MRIIFKIITIVFAIANFGHLISGRVWPIGLVIMLVFAFFGWRKNKKEK